ncbi:hypothetical protein LSTR_LSTR014586 [Laodelphax striatellus]|uniref:Uncharacterized protein n=1 Tax=Laodelphax striatellus TaxID=195883 RepID=A0A482XEK9_LAOST|nr:hypothetical protein LSTR_LSTR014586 [Laodelphax striatellus]
MLIVYQQQQQQQPILPQQPLSAQYQYQLQQQQQYQEPYQDAYQDAYQETYQDPSFTATSYQESYQDTNTMYQDTNAMYQDTNVMYQDTMYQEQQQTTNCYQEAQTTSSYQEQLSRKEPLSRRDTFKRSAATMRQSPKQQNTDSLESGEGDMRDSFETAVSSVSSSMPQPVRSVVKSLYEGFGGALSGVLKSATESAAPVIATIPESAPQPAPEERIVYPSRNDFTDTLYATNRMVGERDSFSSERTVKEAEGFKGESRLAKERDSISSERSAKTIYQPSPQQTLATGSATASPTPMGFQNHQQQPRGLLQPQESIDSYTEDAPLHRYGDEGPSGHRYAEEAPHSSGGPSIRYSEDQNRYLEDQNRYEDRYDDEDEELDLDLEEDDLEGPLEEQDSYELERNLESLGSEELVAGERMESIEEPTTSDKAKSVSFEEDEPDKMAAPIDSGVVSMVTQPVKAERKRTAKERWHWAYNKIINQLNVSRI